MSYCLSNKLFLVGKDCAQTSIDDKSPWWKVDLLQTVSIAVVNVTFAMDAPMIKRWQPFPVSFLKR